MDTTPIICLGCGEVHVVGNVRCPNCYRCPNCGRRIKTDDVTACPQCGHPGRAQQLEETIRKCDPSDPHHTDLHRIREGEYDYERFAPRVRWGRFMLFILGAINLPCISLAILVNSLRQTDSAFPNIVAQFATTLLVIYSFFKVTAGKWPSFLKPEAALKEGEKRSEH